jgi:uncharacterized protein
MDYRDHAKPPRGRSCGKAALPPWPLQPDQSLKHHTKASAPAQPLGVLASWRLGVRFHIAAYLTKGAETLTPRPNCDRFRRMDRQTVIERLKRNQTGLEALGLSRVSLFGSTARDQASAGSDVDLAVTLNAAAGIDLFRFAALSEHVRQLLGVPVDLVVEPARNARIQAEIDRDRLRVY